MGRPKNGPTLAQRASNLFCQLENAVEAEPVGRAPIVRGGVLYSILAKEGKIEFEISGHNWRTVKILVGPCAGKSTAPNPGGHKAWMVGDKNGARRLSGGKEGLKNQDQGKDKLLERLQAARAGRL